MKLFYNIFKLKNKLFIIFINKNIIFKINYDKYSSQKGRV